MNNTVLGNYPVPNPIPSSYLVNNQSQPRLIIIGEGVLNRLNSFGLAIDDLADPDKLFNIFTPREFNTFYNVCDFTTPGYGRLPDLVGMDFLPFNKYSLIGEKQQHPTEVSKKYIDMLQYTPFELSPVEVLSFQLGYSIDKVPELLNFEMKFLGDNLFVGIVSEPEPMGSERHLYNVCDTACKKLHDIYGLRWVAKTRIFSELIRLSQSSALNRNS